MSKSLILFISISEFDFFLIELLYNQLKDALYCENVIPSPI